MSSQTHYELLGVRDDAAPEVIRASYRALIRKHHPDVAGAAGETFTGLLNHAYDELSNPVRRRAYDRSIAEQTPAARPPVRPHTAPSGVPSYTPPRQRRTDPRPPDVGFYTNARDAFDRYESSIPWTLARFRFWAWSWLCAALVLLASMGFLFWNAFLSPIASSPLRALPIPLVVLAALVVLIPNPSTWLKVAFLLSSAAVGLSAIGFPQMAFLIEAIGYPPVLASALLGPGVLISRLTVTRAVELWRVRPVTK